MIILVLLFKKSSQSQFALNLLDQIIFSSTCRLPQGKLLVLEWLLWAMCRSYQRRWEGWDFFFLILISFKWVQFVIWAYFLYHFFFIKVSLATDLMYNYMSRDVTSSVGYDYILRQVYLQIYSTVSELWILARAFVCMTFILRSLNAISIFRKRFTKYGLLFTL